MNKVETGQRMAEFLQLLLSGIAGAAVDPKEIDSLNQCSAPGNPEPEFMGPVDDSKSFHGLKVFAESLCKDPTCRTIILDHMDSELSEDGIWLLIPKLQALLDLPLVHWQVVTLRSVKAQVFRESFDGWNVSGTEEREGTAFVSKQDGSSSALFSDQPRVVAHYGRKLGSQLWKKSSKDHSSPQIVVRLFRCAPRASLIEPIQRILAEDRTDNLFDIWIRHHEVPDNSLEDLGAYKHAADNENIGVLEKLSSFVFPQQDSTSVCDAPPLDTALNLDETTILAKENKEPPQVATEKHTSAELSLFPTVEASSGTKQAKFPREGLNETKQAAPKQTSLSCLSTPEVNCSACMLDKMKADFSKAQLRKSRKRCKDCVQSGRPLEG